MTSGLRSDGCLLFYVIYNPGGGADGRSRTGTAFATAPSRQRVYQFHHIGEHLTNGTWLFTYQSFL